VTATRAGTIIGLAFAFVAMADGGAMVDGQAAAQTYQERNHAAARCYRDAQRSVGAPPRDRVRPGDDLVAMERRRRDYDDRFSSYLDRCLLEADRQLRQKRP